MAKRILVIDDEPNVVKSCVKMLQMEGFDVQGVVSGAEALDLYQRQEFDLVLTDLKMPDMDGLEILTRIKKHNPNAAVVIFTAYGTKENVVEALRLGAREFLEKPLESRTLTATVRRILEQGSSSIVRGNLRSMSLPSIVQINCTERNQALLHLRRRGQEGKVYFADGEVVHATLGSLVGEEAFYQLLGWEDGDFELEMGVSSIKRTITAGWSGLLLEGMRRLDEGLAGLELEGEIAKGVRGEMTQEVVRTLKKIEGVVGVVVAARDGIVLAHDLEGDPDREGAVAVFVGNAAGQAGETMSLGAFDWGTIAIGKDVMLVMEQPNYYVGLLLSERASPSLVAPAAKRVLESGA